MKTPKSEHCRSNVRISVNWLYFTIKRRNPNVRMNQTFEIRTLYNRTIDRSAFGRWLLFSLKERHFCHTNCFIIFFLDIKNFWCIDHFNIFKLERKTLYPCQSFQNVSDQKKDNFDALIIYFENYHSTISLPLHLRFVEVCFSQPS